MISLFSYRYILKEGCLNRHPFISIKEANLSISFACVSYMNSSKSLRLLSDHKRASVMVHGFHGLQIYANQFWFNHVLDYLRMQDGEQVNPPNEFLEQLYSLLEFDKEAQKGNIHTYSEMSISGTLLKVDALISKVKSFRVSLRSDEIFDSTPEGMIICT
jgi:hypothetical protein